MVRKENREVFITDDNKVFLEEAEALIYEDKLIVTRYLIEYNEGLTTELGILELEYARDCGYAYAIDYCYERFGKMVTYEKGDFTKPKSNWTIVKELKYDEFVLFSGIYNVLARVTGSLCDVGPYPYWLFKDTKK